MEQMVTTTTLTGHTTRRKESLMASIHSITISSKPAPEAGALDGFEARCSCGFHQATSLSEREARNLGFAHVAWAQKTGR